MKPAVAPKASDLAKLKSFYVSIESRAISGDHVAREKVGQTMRDMLHTKYKSSTKSKKHRRKEIQAKQNDEIDDFLSLNCPDITERVKQLSLKSKTEGKRSL